MRRKGDDSTMCTVWQLINRAEGNWEWKEGVVYGSGCGTVDYSTL